MDTKILQKLFVHKETSIKEAMQCIDKYGLGIAIVVDKSQRLEGTITDGDIRRAILKGLDLDESIAQILESRPSTPYPAPVTARDGTDDLEILKIMQETGLRWIPILNEINQVVNLITLEDLVATEPLELDAVIMAGGQGKRLRPLTEDLPKPMLPVGGRPLMELIIDQLKQTGIKKINITTHYKPEKIIEHFGNGNKFGVDLNYVQENQPLGTAGALGLMERPEKPILVMNGDILTKVNFKAMMEFHQEHNADLTMAVRQHLINVPYGVIECDEEKISQIKEKPQIKLFVNAGIYLLEPSVFDFIPSGDFFNMTDLIQWLLDAGKNVVSFPVGEYWLDIGQYNDYNQAKSDVNEGRMKI